MDDKLSAHYLGKKWNKCVKKDKTTEKWDIL